jgi:hypothetical protein
MSDAEDPSGNSGESDNAYRSRYEPMPSAI